MPQLNLRIEDMTCIHCAKRVEMALRRIAGVGEAHVNLAEKTATVDYDAEQTGAMELSNAVRDEGFTPGVTRTRMAVEGMRCASCVSQVESALPTTPGVVSASVNSVAAEVYIEYRPALAAPANGTDMMVAEIKQARAQVNPGSRNRQVLAAAMTRFGCCDANEAPSLVQALLQRGRAQGTTGHVLRMVLFAPRGLHRRARRVCR